MFRDVKITGVVVQKTSNFRYLFAKTIEWRTKGDDIVSKREIESVGFDFFTFDSVQKESKWDRWNVGREMGGITSEFNAVLMYQPTCGFNLDDDDFFQSLLGEALGRKSFKLNKKEQREDYWDVGFLVEN